MSSHLIKKSFVTVVNATWKDGELLFSLEHGYALDGQSPTDRITFKMDHVTLNQTGRYACVPAGYQYRNVGTCTLSLKSGKHWLHCIRYLLVNNNSRLNSQASCYCIKPTKKSIRARGIIYVYFLVFVYKIVLI